MRTQVLVNHQSHGLGLPTQEQFDHQHFTHSLQVESKQGKTATHGDEDGQEDAQDQAQVHGQDGQRQVVIDAQTVSHAKQAKQQEGRDVILTFVDDVDVN